MILDDLAVDAGAFKRRHELGGEARRCMQGRRVRALARRRPAARRLSRRHGPRRAARYAARVRRRVFFFDTTGGGSRVLATAQAPELELPIRRREPLQAFESSRPEGVARGVALRGEAAASRSAVWQTLRERLRPRGLEIVTVRAQRRPRRRAHLAVEAVASAAPVADRLGPRHRRAVRVRERAERCGDRRAGNDGAPVPTRASGSQRVPPSRSARSIWTRCHPTSPTSCTRRARSRAIPTSTSR